VRVVSLVPSATETLLAWGVDVVACTRFCEQPALPHVGGTKDPAIEQIIELAPDLVVVDREENRRADADALVAAGLTVHVTHVTHIDHVAPTLRDLAIAAGVAVEDGPTPAVGADGSRLDLAAFIPIWRRPTMTIGRATYASSLLARLGVSNVMARRPDATDRYPTLELDEVAALAPDVVLLPSEPYPFAERHVARYAAAIPGAQVVLVDGQDLFWWGVRTPAALARLRDTLRAATSPS
jgi:ABC-type hemin transport system substrate-binding protein